MGIGRATGEDRAVEAAKAAVNSPLLEVSIDGAKGVLFNVSGSDDLSMTEINEAAKVITESIDPEAKVIFGAVMDDKLKKGEIKVTVIATGFDEGLIRKAGERIQDISPINKTIEKEKKKQTFTVSRPKATIVAEDQESDEWDIPAFIRRKMK